MGKIIERFFNSRDELQSSLLANTEYQLEKAIQQSGSASMMLSGGSTPKPLYQSLSKSQIPWQLVTIGMVDERWISSEDEASNERFIRLNLLNHLPQKPKFLSMKTEEKDPFSANQSVSHQYKQMHTPFDLTILGMGNDGHTASLFPNARGLNDALKNQQDLCVGIDAIPSEVTGQHTQRMTLTLKAIKSSKVIKLLITGKDKLATYHRALQGNDIENMPIRAILHQNDTPVIVYWAE